MLADALVPIERRTVLEWLLDPILRGLNDSVGRGSRAADDAPPLMLELRVLRARARCRSSPRSELNECGLACLAAISGYFEGEPGLAEIRQLAVPSGRGETLLELRNLAERIGLGGARRQGRRSRRWRSSRCRRSCTGR